MKLQFFFYSYPDRIYREPTQRKFFLVNLSRIIMACAAVIPRREENFMATYKRYQGQLSRQTKGSSFQYFNTERKERKREREKVN